MHANYLRNVINSVTRLDVVAKARRRLRRERFDTIAVRGVSGISIGAILAHGLKKELAVVRKEMNPLHTDNVVESPQAVVRYVIVDDFSSSGETLYHITRNMRTSHPNALCVGLLQYNRIDLFKEAEDVEDMVKNFIRLYPEKAVLESKIV